jgi:putative Ig domain-containing protein
VPDGLALSATGVLSGTPTSEGTGDFVVQIVDTAGVTAEKRVTLLIKPLPNPPPTLAVNSSAPLPGGTVGTAYLERLQAVGGTPPYKWVITNRKPPENVELAPDTGILRGTPQKAGPSSFEVQATDNAGKTAKKDLTVSIGQPTAATATPAVGTGVKPSRVPPLEEVFDLGKNLLGLLVAAIFGLAPGLLFDRLQQQVDTYRADLKSSQAGQGAAPRT